jgi:hypothetical protein
MSYWYDLYTRKIFGPVIVAENVLPTPMLMDAAYNRPDGVDAYESDPATDGHPAVWRVRDDAYDAKHAPGATYTRIYHVTKHEES